MRQSAALNDVLFFCDLDSLGLGRAVPAGLWRDFLALAIRDHLGGRDDFGDRGRLTNRPVVPAKLVRLDPLPFLLAHALSRAEVVPADGEFEYRFGTYADEKLTLIERSDLLFFDRQEVGRIFRQVRVRPSRHFDVACSR